VRVFKDKGFVRFADKEGINDDILRKVAADQDYGMPTWGAAFTNNTSPDQERVSVAGIGQ
jgi:hypothetical protein